MKIFVESQNVNECIKKKPLVGLFFYNKLWYMISFQLTHPVVIFVRQGWGQGDLRKRECVYFNVSYSAVTCNSATV